MSGNLGKHEKSGNTQGICDSDLEAKGLGYVFGHIPQFGVYASCAMCPSCVH